MRLITVADHFTSHNNLLHFPIREGSKAFSELFLDRTFLYEINITPLNTRTTGVFNQTQINYKNVHLQNIN